MYPFTVRTEAFSFIGQVFVFTIIRTPYKVTSGWLLMTIMIIVAYCNIYSNVWIVVKVYYSHPCTCDTYDYIIQT